MAAGWDISYIDGDVFCSLFDFCSNRNGSFYFFRFSPPISFASWNKPEKPPSRMIFNINFLSPQLSLHTQPSTQLDSPVLKRTAVVVIAIAVEELKDHIRRLMIQWRSGQQLLHAAHGGNCPERAHALQQDTCLIVGQRRHALDQNLDTGLTRR